MESQIEQTNIVDSSLFQKTQINLEELFNKYENNPNIQEKIQDYISNKLPTIIENFIVYKEERNNRKEFLNDRSSKFINSFLTNNEITFFYIPVSELFICYTNNHYKIINEDAIWDLVLKELNQNKSLTPWKYKIKNNIIKQIKEKYLLTHIPESPTIQTILSIIMSSLYISKEKAKYILTILGDNMLKKSNIVYFTNINTKKWFDYISDLTYSFFKYSRNPIHNIKFKYYYHDYNNSRLINLNNEFNYNNNGVYNSILKEHILDIICVACHYSNRFKNADKFLLNYCSNDDLKNYAFYLKNHSKENIICEFKEKYLEPSNDKHLFLNHKNMVFLWKDFLKNKNLPLLLFFNELKQELNTETVTLFYNEITDLYENITSNKLSFIEKFNIFWEKYIIKDEKETDFEINELVLIYNNITPVNKLDENTILSIIEHFYDIEITEKKYIHGIKCILWDKKQQIDNALENYNSKSSISLLELYKFYCSYSQLQHYKYIVNKQYFEKYIYCVISEEYIINDTISFEYWCTI